MSNVNIREFKISYIVITSYSIHYTKLYEGFEYCMQCIGCASYLVKGLVAGNPVRAE